MELYLPIIANIFLTNIYHQLFPGLLSNSCFPALAPLTCLTPDSFFPALVTGYMFWFAVVVVVVFKFSRQVCYIFCSSSFTCNTVLFSGFVLIFCGVEPCPNSGC